MAGRTLFIAHISLDISLCPIAVGLLVTSFKVWYNALKFSLIVSLIELIATLQMKLLTLRAVQKNVYSVFVEIFHRLVKGYAVSF